MCEYSAARRHQNGAVLAHRLIGRDVFGVHPLRFFYQSIFDLLQREMRKRFQLLAHALDRPKKIHSRRAGDPLRLAYDFKLFPELGELFRFAVTCAQRNAHARSHADSGRAAHHHVADGVRDLLVRLGQQVHLFRGQLRLVDEADALRGPFQCFNHTLIL